MDDAARGILLATELYDGQEPVNLGNSREITIADLTTLIATLTGYQGELRWDASKPDGQPRRALDTTRAHECFGFLAQHSFEDGLREAIDWYRQSRRSAPSRSGVPAS